MHRSAAAFTDHVVGLSSNGLKLLGGGAVRRAVFAHAESRVEGGILQTEVMQSQLRFTAEGGAVVQHNVAASFGVARQLPVCTWRRLKGQDTPRIANQVR